MGCGFAVFGIMPVAAQTTPPAPQSPRVPTASVSCAGATDAGHATCATSCPTTCREQGTTWGGGSWNCDPAYRPVCAPTGSTFACSFRCALAAGAADGSSATGTASAPSSGGSSIELSNPLGTTSIHVIIGRVIRGVLGIVGSIALLMFVYGGVRWIAAGGSDENVKAAQKILANATIGLLIIFSSYTAVSIFLSLF